MLFISVSLTVCFCR